MPFEKETRYDINGHENLSLSVAERTSFGQNGHVNISYHAKLYRGNLATEICEGNIWDTFLKELNRYLEARRYDLVRRTA